MITLLRTFVVWLLLLALPYQGYAAASMMLCAMGSPASVTTHAAGAAGLGHDHAAMLAAQAHDQHDQHEHASTSSHDGVKCGTGSACCVGAALTPALALALPALDVESSAIPFLADYLPAVHLAHPERPPQALRA